MFAGLNSFPNTLLMPETRQSLACKREQTALKHLAYLHTFHCQIHNTNVYLTRNLCIWKWISSCRFYHLRRTIFYEAGSYVGLPVNMNGNKRSWLYFLPHFETSAALIKHLTVLSAQRQPVKSCSWNCTCLSLHKYKHNGGRMPDSRLEQDIHCNSAHTSTRRRKEDGSVARTISEPLCGILRSYKGSLKTISFTPWTFTWEYTEAQNMKTFPKVCRKRTNFAKFFAFCATDNN